jgi:hypothetical protein
VDATVVAVGVVAVVADVVTGFFFLVEASTVDCSCETGWVVGRAAEADTTDCFFVGIGGIIYYFMITYIIICLYNFLNFIKNCVIFNLQGCKNETKPCKNRNPSFNILQDSLISKRVNFGNCSYGNEHDFCFYITYIT